MVEKMKKYSFLIYHQTYGDFLENLRQAGVVHVVVKQKGIPDDATDLRKQLAASDLLKNTIYALQHRLADRNDIAPKPLNASADGIQAQTVYEQLKTQSENLKAQQQVLQKEIDQMTVWGDFDLDMLGKIEQAGRQIRFYSCREREFLPEWADRFNAVKVAHIGSQIYFVTFTPAGFEEEPDAEKARISDRSLSRLQEAMHENRRQMEETEQQIDLLAIEHLNNLKEAQRQLLENIDLNRVHLQAEKKADEKLVLLEGWVPEEKETGLLRTLETQDVYCIGGTPPDKDDNTAPVLLKNNKFAKLFEPIGEMYSLPNYHEIDLTPFFAPFFMLFFGICLGDAGYGLLLLVATLIARPKMKPALRPILTLAAILGATAVFCGFVSGTIFGIQLLNMEWAWLSSLKRMMLNSDQMFNLSLILGGIQILFGMFIKAIGVVRRYGWAYSLEKWGWIILLIGGGSLYYLYDKEMFKQAPLVTYTVLGISALFIFILSDIKRNPLINIGEGLWNTFNMITGLLGDFLSYIRLFALGLCGGVMGFVFNDLALKLSAEAPIIIGQLLMIIIMLLGHSINIFMSGIGAFVHPLRLTFVEFYKSSGFQGGGKKYKPFKHIAAEES
jgi:V/A-type H+-transporting ATPase subunit I